MIVFWTKNAAPLFAHLDEIDSIGFRGRYYFQYTVTCYPRVLEPNSPSLEAAVQTLRKLADRIGPERIVWRYDPILLTSVTDYPYHRAHFTELAQALAPFSRRCVVSLADLHYRGPAVRLRRLEQQGIRLIEADPASSEFEDLLRSIHAEARARGWEVVSCAEDLPLERFGIAPGKCVDEYLIASALGVRVQGRKDPHQRPRCRCVESQDIGWYSTCPNGCVFCYATQSATLVEANRKAHSPSSPCLVGGGDYLP